MSCLDKPKKLEATQSENLLAKTAREQYEKYKAQIIPLENRAIEDANNAGSAGEALRAEERAVNSSRENFAPVQAMDPNNGQSALGLNIARAKAGSRASSEGKQANKGRELGLKSNVVSLGRGISTTASAANRRSVSMDVGNKAAEVASQNALTNSKLQLAGQVAGLGGTVYADSRGWLTKKSTGSEG